MDAIQVLFSEMRKLELTEAESFAQVHTTSSEQHIQDKDSDMIYTKSWAPFCFLISFKLIINSQGFKNIHGIKRPKIPHELRANGVCSGFDVNQHGLLQAIKVSHYTVPYKLKELKHALSHSKYSINGSYYHQLYADW